MGLLTRAGPNMRRPLDFNWAQDVGHLAGGFNGGIVPGSVRTGGGAGGGSTPTPQAPPPGMPPPQMAPQMSGPLLQAFSQNPQFQQQLAGLMGGQSPGFMPLQFMKPPGG